MPMITDPLAMAIVVFFLGAAATLGLQPAGRATDELESGMVFRLLLGPACLAAIILILSGVADRLYFAG